MVDSNLVDNVGGVMSANAKRHDIQHDGHHVGYVEIVGRYGGKTKASAKLVNVANIIQG